MPFGVVSGVGLGMGVLDFGDDRRRGRGSLGVNLRNPIVITNGDFVASLCESAYNDRAVVWRGEWGGPRHSCVRWKSTCLKGKGLLQAVAVRGGPDTTRATGIVLSVNIHATARYTLSAIEYSTGCSNKIISVSVCISTRFRR